ncbi:Uncharacterized protein Fot_03909 [Forsythia ovata]|uniref:Uncharacterized protein n=1 Tax=Forsythia ovata TaxID=205694 RepID=A0ABD1XB14_9LAMI
MESMTNYVLEMLKKLGAESMMENIQMQVKLKGIDAVSAMKIFKEKLDKTGTTYKVMNYLQEKLKKLGAESMMENVKMQVILKGMEAVSAIKIFIEKLGMTGNTYKVMNYLQQKLAHSQFIVIIIMVVVLVVFVSSFGGKAGSKTMKAPGRKTGERILRNKFENDPRSYFQNLRGKKNKLN